MKKMKEKIIFGIFVLATLAINFITVSKTNVNGLSMMNLIQTSKANMQELDFCSSTWTVTYILRESTTTIICESGGSYICPMCNKL